MKTVKQTNLIDEPADALIYSTNILLNLTGGVGAQLLERYGTPLQEALYEWLKTHGVKHAQQGDVIELMVPGMPWKALFHTLPCDPMYHTNQKVVAQILRHCFNRCLEIGSIKRVALSALATGYGDMHKEDFLTVFDSVALDYSDKLDMVLCLAE